MNALAETVAENTAVQPTLSPWVYVAAAVLGALIAGVYLYWRSAPKQLLKPFAELLENQIVLDELDMNDIRRWAEQGKQVAKPGTCAIFIRPTKQGVNKLGYNYPEDFDAQSHLIGFIADQDTGEMLRITLFSFGSVTPKAKDELLERTPYVVRY